MRVIYTRSVSNEPRAMSKGEQKNQDDLKKYALFFLPHFFFFTFGEVSDIFALSRVLLFCVARVFQTSLYPHPRCDVV